MHIAIIGGGITGLLSAAALLEKPGVSVTLLEAGRGVALQASGANAAQLSYTYVNPLGSPALFSALPGILLGRNKGLRILKWDVALMLWGLRLLWNSTPAHYRANRRALLELSLESRKRLAALREKTGIRLRPHHPGKVQLYPNAGGFADAEDLAKELKPRGIDLQLWDAQETARRLPGFNLAAKPLFGALYSPVDEAAGCANFCNDLLGWLRTQPGFSVRFNAGLEKWQKQDGKIARVHLTGGAEMAADAFLLCAGAGTNAALKPLGRHLPIYPVKGYTLEFPSPPEGLPYSITDHAQKVVFVPFGDKILVSGLFHFAGHDSTVPQEVVDAIAQCARLRLPGLDVSNPVARTGLRPCTPGSQPIIGALVQNLYVNSGQGMYGWTLAAASAAKAAELIG